MFTKKIAAALIVISGLAGLFLAACGPAAQVTEQSKALTIDTTSLADGQVGIVYSQTLKASGGSGNYTWSVTSGALPPGFTLVSNNGGIYGTASSGGTSNFTVQVSDGTNTVTKAFSITIKSSLSPLFINTSSLDPNEVGAPYNRELSASGGSGQYTWSITNGALPDGLKLDGATGIISGTATKVGTYGFTIHVDDGAGNTSDQALNLQIFPAPYISLKACTDGVVGTNYFQIVDISGGTEQINNVYSTWTIINGSLPPGLSIDSYGDISGKPQTEGTYNFTVKCQDKLGGVATKDLSITITK